LPVAVAVAVAVAVVGRQAKQLDGPTIRPPDVNVAVGQALGMVNHVVMFRFRDRSPEHLAHCKSLLEALPAKVPQIRQFEVGVNARPSDRAYDLSVYSRFDSWEDLEIYAANPDHVEVATYLRSAMDTSGLVDYET
jgi:hypothetical protein